MVRDAHPVSDSVFISHKQIDAYHAVFALLHITPPEAAVRGVSMGAGIMYWVHRTGSFLIRALLTH